MKKVLIEEKIERFLTTLDRWNEATDDDGELLDGPEFDAHVMAVAAFVHHTCWSSAEIKRKIEFVISHAYLQETVQGNPRLFVAFMRSVIVPSEQAQQLQQNGGTRTEGHSLPQEIAAMGETFQPHQNGEDG